MSEKTNISWATSTGNPWIGCTKVSPGCKNCYAATLDENRFSRTMGGGTPEKPVSHWGKGAPRFRTEAFWKDAVKWNAAIEREDFERARAGESAIDDEPIAHPRVFPSLCDIFDPEVPPQWRADYFQLVHDTPYLDHLILTKRPELVKQQLGQALEISRVNQSGTLEGAAFMIGSWLNGSPPENVWLGVSVENQKQADLRIPALLKIPAVVRFLSVEPLLEAVELKLPRIAIDENGYGHGIDWIIVGGESGPGRRDCGVESIESVARQCFQALVPCFVKQDCDSKPGQRGRIDWEAWRLKQFPNISHA